MRSLVVAARKRERHEPDDTVAYWRTRPVAERMAFIEELRRDHHGSDYDTGPMTLVVRRRRLHKDRPRIECSSAKTTAISSVVS